jgi:uncharacterized protein (TIGR01244 family)
MTFAKVTKVTETLSVATQPDLADFETFAKQGYVAVINNRPDGEEPTQPDSSAEQDAAQAAGLDYRHIPVTGAALTIDDVRAFQAVVAAASGPVLAHCKSRDPLADALCDRRGARRAPVGRRRAIFWREAWLRSSRR